MFKTFLSLQLKRTFKQLPLLLLGTMLLFLMTGSIAFLSSKKLYSDNVAEKLIIAVVYPENASAENFFIGVLKQQETLKNMVTFKEMKKEEAELSLKQGKVEAVIIMPENFIKDILSGVNTPAKVILNENKPVESRLFRTLSLAGSETLSATQASLYAIGDYFAEKKVSGPDFERMNKDINDKNLTLTLGRANLFKVDTISAVGKMDSLTYFFSSWMILFLLLMGIMEAFILIPFNRGMNIKLSIFGICKYKRLAIDEIRMFILEIIFIIEIVILWFLSSLFLDTDFAFKAIDVIRLLSLAFSVSSFILMIYNLGKNTLSSMLTLFIASFTMIFYSGGFIPSAFLPSVVRNTQHLIPTTIWMSNLGDFLISETSYRNIILSLVLGLIFTGITTFILSMRKEEL